MLYYDDYKNHEGMKDLGISLPEIVKSVEFCYDGGRLSVSVNGRVLYETKQASDDFSLEIKK